MIDFLRTTIGKVGNLSQLFSEMPLFLQNSEDKSILLTLDLAFSF
jgi:hypothetical protein